jgi:hypothetical protein
VLVVRERREDLLREPLLDEVDDLLWGHVRGKV